MEVRIKQIKEFVKNKTRIQWQNDPLVKKFINFKSELSEYSIFEKPAFCQNFEIYLGRKLVGDIKVFGDQSDIKKKAAQILIVLGESRGKGIGTEAMKVLLDKLKEMYSAVYCHVNRYNLASIKMLRKNGFLIKNLKGNEVILYRKFALKP